MAKENGVRNEIPIWIKVGLGMAGFAILIWSTSWAASRDEAASGYIVSSHETRLTKVEVDVDVLDNRLDNNEKSQIALQKDQQAILSNQGEMKIQITKQTDLQMEQIKESAKLNAFLRTLDKIE